jgi:hypothetical protein
MKLLAITSNLLVAFSSATAAAASSSDPLSNAANLHVRDADAGAPPRQYSGFWGFRWSRHGTAGIKREAAPAAAAEPSPGWWGFKLNRKHVSDAGSNQKAEKRDVPPPAPGADGGAAVDGAPADDGDDDDEDVEYIYLPKGMNPDDLAKMLRDAQQTEREEKEKEAKKEGETGGKA